jgi:hypothetical protein
VPEYADPLDHERWISLINEYSLTGSARAKAQHERMAELVHPTWEQHFELVDAFLAQLDAPTTIGQKSP